MKSTNKGFGGKDKSIKRSLSDDFEYLSQIEKATIFAREGKLLDAETCLLYTSPSPRD